MKMMNTLGNAKTACPPPVPNAPLAASVRMLQLLTVGWMSVELLVSLVTGIRAHSVSLIAFAGDSGVELLSALVVLWRFRLGPHVEKTAARINAGLLYALAAYIVVMSVLNLLGKGPKPKPSLIGIALLVSAALIMPLLGTYKKRLALATRSSALKADAAQSNLCAYMSWIALSGLVINALWKVAIADSIAALLLLPIILLEANETRKGEICDC